jgi:uncharacterized membrane protein
MNIAFASCAELMVEAKRTQSLKKRLRIAGELQRRHDELNMRPGYGKVWWVYAGEKIVNEGWRLVKRECWYTIPRQDFRLLFAMMFGDSRSR